MRLSLESSPLEELFCENTACPFYGFAKSLIFLLNDLGLLEEPGSWGFSSHLSSIPYWFKQLHFNKIQVKSPVLMTGFC